MRTLTWALVVVCVFLLTTWLWMGKPAPPPASNTMMMGHPPPRDSMTFAHAPVCAASAATVSGEPSDAQQPDAFSQVV